MTVPSRSEAASLLLSLGPPAWHVRHAAAVAEIAAWLAARVASRGGSASHGRPIDRRLVEAAALLHDVDKILPKTDPARALRHGVGSAAWLERHGHGELGEVVRGHPITRLASEDGERWLAEASPEARLVAYADRRAAQRLVPMSTRFAGWAIRYPGGWSPETARVARDRAERLEREACRLAGCEPGDVRRLPWVGRALAAARAASR